MEGNEITLSICCITYNQDDYIQYALDGFENQIVDFTLEIIIYDDCSTDATRKKLISYKETSKFQVKLMLSPENRFSQGDRIFLKTIKLAQGKYIALCEGDDYWSDPLKLQKQVDLLETHGEYVISAHNSNVVNAKGQFVKLFNTQPVPEVTNTTYILSQDWYIPTASMVFRREYLVIPDWYYQGLNGDYMLQLLLTASGGLVHYSNEVRSSYRWHEQGLSKIFNKKNTFSYAMLFINKRFNHFTEGQYRTQIRANVKKHSFKILELTSVWSKEFWRVLINMVWFNKGMTGNDLQQLYRRLFKDKC